MLPTLRPLDGSRADLTGGDWGFVLLCGAALLGAMVLAAVPIAVARRRGNPSHELVLAASLFWAAAAGWSAISWILARWNWEKEKNTLMLAGYYKTVVNDPGPQAPVLWWIGLAVVYAGLLGLSLRKRDSGSP